MLAIGRRTDSVWSREETEVGVGDESSDSQRHGNDPIAGQKATGRGVVYVHVLQGQTGDSSFY